MKLKICLLSILLMSFSGIAFAQQSPNQQPSNESKCGPRASFIEFSQERWQQGQLFLGMINPNTALELFVNEETQTWSIITSRADGFSCILTYGEGIKIFNNTDSEE